MLKVMPRSQSNTAHARIIRRCALRIYWTTSPTHLAQDIGGIHCGDTGYYASEALVTR